MRFSVFDDSGGQKATSPPTKSAPVAKEKTKGGDEPWFYEFVTELATGKTDVSKTEVSKDGRDDEDGITFEKVMDIVAFPEKLFSSEREEDSNKKNEKVAETLPDQRTYRTSASFDDSPRSKPRNKYDPAPGPTFTDFEMDRSDQEIRPASSYSSYSSFTGMFKRKPKKKSFETTGRDFAPNRPQRPHDSRRRSGTRGTRGRDVSPQRNQRGQTSYDDEDSSDGYSYDSYEEDNSSRDRGQRRASAWRRPMKGERSGGDDFRRSQRTRPPFRLGGSKDSRGAAREEQAPTRPRGQGRDPRYGRAPTPEEDLYNARREGRDPRYGRPPPHEEEYFSSTRNKGRDPRYGFSPHQEERFSSTHKQARDQRYGSPTPEEEHFSRVPEQHYNSSERAWDNSAVVRDERDYEMGSGFEEAVVCREEDTSDSSYPVVWGANRRKSQRAPKRSVPPSSPQRGNLLDDSLPEERYSEHWSRSYDNSEDPQVEKTPSWTSSENSYVTPSPRRQSPPLSPSRRAAYPEEGYPSNSSAHGQALSSGSVPTSTPAERSIPTSSPPQQSRALTPAQAPAGDSLVAPFQASSFDWIKAAVVGLVGKSPEATCGDEGVDAFMDTVAFPERHIKCTAPNLNCPTNSNYTTSSKNKNQSRSSAALVQAPSCNSESVASFMDVVAFPERHINCTSYDNKSEDRNSTSQPQGARLDRSSTALVQASGCSGENIASVMDVIAFPERHVDCTAINNMEFPKDRLTCNSKYNDGPAPDNHFGCNSPLVDRAVDTLAFPEKHFNCASPASAEANPNGVQNRGVQHHTQDERAEIASFEEARAGPAFVDKNMNTLMPDDSGELATPRLSVAASSSQRSEEQKWVEASTTASSETVRTRNSKGPNQESSRSEEQSVAPSLSGKSVRSSISKGSTASKRSVRKQSLFRRFSIRKAPKNTSEAHDTPRPASKPSTSAKALDVETALSSKGVAVYPLQNNTRSAPDTPPPQARGSGRSTKGAVRENNMVVSEPGAPTMFDATMDVIAFPERHVKCPESSRPMCASGTARSVDPSKRASTKPQGRQRDALDSFFEGCETTVCREDRDTSTNSYPVVREEASAAGCLICEEPIPGRDRTNLDDLEIPENLRRDQSLISESSAESSRPQQVVQPVWVETQTQTEKPKRRNRLRRFLSKSKKGSEKVKRGNTSKKGAATTSGEF